MLIKSVICVNLWLDVVVNEGEECGAHKVLLARSDTRFLNS